MSKRQPIIVESPYDDATDSMVGVALTVYSMHTGLPFHKMLGRGNSSGSVAHFALARIKEFATLLEKKIQEQDAEMGDKAPKYDPSSMEVDA